MFAMGRGCYASDHYLSVFHKYSLGGDTTAPSGLYARLCSAFPVSHKTKAHVVTVAQLFMSFYLLTCLLTLGRHQVLLSEWQNAEPIQPTRLGLLLRITHSVQSSSHSSTRPPASPPLSLSLSSLGSIGRRPAIISFGGEPIVSRYDPARRGAATCRLGGKCRSEPDKLTNAPASDCDVEGSVDQLAPMSTPR